MAWRKDLDRERRRGRVYNPDRNEHLTDDGMCFYLGGSKYVSIYCMSRVRG